MSTRYKKPEDVPSEVLASRLMELDRDADCVMVEAAKRLRSMEAQREAVAAAVPDAVPEARFGNMAVDVQKLAEVFREAMSWGRSGNLSRRRRRMGLQFLWPKGDLSTALSGSKSSSGGQSMTTS